MDEHLKLFVVTILSVPIVSAETIFCTIPRPIYLLNIRKKNESPAIKLQKQEQIYSDVLLTSQDVFIQVLNIFDFVVMSSFVKDKF